MGEKLKKAMPTRAKTEIPPFDLTVVHGDDKDGNRKLTLTIEKDDSLSELELQTIQDVVKDALRLLGNRYLKG